MIMSNNWLIDSSPRRSKRTMEGLHQDQNPELEERVLDPQPEAGVDLQPDAGLDLQPDAGLDQNFEAALDQDLEAAINPDFPLIPNLEAEYPGNPGLENFLLDLDSEDEI